MSWLEGLPASMATSIVRLKAPSPDPHLQLDPRQGPGWGLASSSSPRGVPESKDKVRHRDAESEGPLGKVARGTEVPARAKGQRQEREGLGNAKTPGLAGTSCSFCVWHL